MPPEIVANHSAHGRILIRRSAETLAPKGRSRSRGRPRTGSDCADASAQGQTCRRRVSTALKSSVGTELVSRARTADVRAGGAATCRDALDEGPLISIVVPVFDPPISAVASMLESVLAQTYDPGSYVSLMLGETTGRALLDELAERDKRLKIVHLESNRGISANSNAALKLASGEFVALLDHDDDLAPEALFAVAEAIIDIQMPTSLQRRGSADARRPQGAALPEARLEPRIAS